jgi:hypothetical protein
MTSTLGVPLDGCCVQIFNAEQQTLLGLSNRNGELVVPREALSGETILVTKVEHAAVRASFDSTPPQDIRIVLSKGASIRGTVVLPDGSAECGVRVLAWPSEWTFADSDIAEDAYRGDLTKGLALTDPSGQFEIRDLDPQRVYAIAAAGNGCASPAGWQTAHPGADPIVVQVFPLHWSSN